jgi:hypothetical protein
MANPLLARGMELSCGAGKNALASNTLLWLATLISSSMMIDRVKASAMKTARVKKAADRNRRCVHKYRSYRPSMVN